MNINSHGQWIINSHGQWIQDSSCWVVILTCLFFSPPRTLQWLFISGIIGKMKGSLFLGQQRKAWPLIIDWSERFGYLISFLSILKDPSPMIWPCRLSCCVYSLMETSSSVSGEESYLLPFVSCTMVVYTKAGLTSAVCLVMLEIGTQAKDVIFFYF